MSDPVTDATQIIRDLLEDDLFARVPYESPERIDTTAALAALAVLENAANDAAPKNSVEWMLVVKDERDRADDAEARAETLTQALRRAVYLAQHLWAMIPREVWRDTGGDDGQGHYEGDYYAEQVRDELAALAAATPNKEKQT